jgi:hypothetical protein
MNSMPEASLRPRSSNRKGAHRVPDFAQGQVRDLRARWALEEAGLPYKTRLLEQRDQDLGERR